ncbi:hypothetical protein MOBT1_001204 [Malassezia obtusa]|uniref:WD repeat-containing protein 48 n=1 Tax=Malassezia obtusa TaxID=76774 RepID=A0AAF0DZQ3_9BASI|nr:hypothetical protein MOBT1_001204 [Malassezia obtusa]
MEAEPATRAPQWNSLRRVSYTLPSLISVEDDPRHRYLPDAAHSQSYALPVLDWTTPKVRQPLGSALHVQLREPSGSSSRPLPARELYPRHIRPVTALATAPQPGALRDASAGHTELLYSAGCDGLVCAWQLGMGAPQFRQSVRAHDNWISSMVLCNQDQTVVTGSSDCTVKAWSPHLDGGATLHELGTHADFVKDLALAASADWIVSAALDANVCLWDLRQGRKAPMWHARCPASIYATGSNRSGSVIATGGVDRIVRGWDPRTRDSTFELVGHQDNVRTLAVAPNGRYILSGSADTTLRLWDVGEQRCLHTFTHHNSSIWSLYTEHETLATFFSGDRDGYLCKVHWDHSADPVQAECVLLAREQASDGQDAPRPAAVQSIVADQEHIWTSNAKTPSLHCWRNLAPYAQRAAMASARGTMHGVPMAHCINLKPTETWSALAAAGLGELAQDVTHSPTATRFAPSDDLVERALARLPPEQQAEMERHLAYTSRLVTEEAAPLDAEPKHEIRGYHGVLRALILNDRIHALSIDTGGIVALWNIAGAACIGTFDVDRVRSAGLEQHLHRQPMLNGNVYPWRPQDTPSDTLAMVQSLIEGDAVVPPWCSLDTSTGELTVHLEQDKVWAAEVYVEDLFRTPYDRPRGGWNEERTYIGACVLRNLFMQLNSAEALLRPAGDAGTPWLLRWLEERQGSPEALVEAPLAQVLPPALLAYAAPNETIWSVLAGMTGSVTLASQTSPAVYNASCDSPTPPLVHVLMKMLRGVQSSATSPTSPPTSPSKSSSDEGTSSASRFGLRRVTPTRKHEKPAPRPAEPHPMNQHVQILRGLLSGPLRDVPPVQNTPRIALSDSTLVSISHDLASSEHQKLGYRGRVGQVARDAPLLELLAPPWLLELLLNARQQDQTQQRLPVIAEAWNSPSGDVRQLPELPPKERQFNVGRMVRAARIATYVQGLLQEAGAPLPPAPATPTDACVEILCNGQPLSQFTTLAQCQRHYWKSSSTIRLQYRRRT